MALFREPHPSSARSSEPPLPSPECRSPVSFGGSVACSSMGPLRMWDVRNMTICDVRSIEMQEDSTIPVSLLRDVLCMWEESTCDWDTHFFSFLFSNLFLAMILSYLITSSGMSGYYVKNNLLEFALSLKTFLFYCTTLTHSLPPIKSIDSFGFTLTAWTAGTRALPWCRSSRLSLELRLRRIHRRQMPFLYLYQIQLSFLVPCFVLHN